MEGRTMLGSAAAGGYSIYHWEEESHWASHVFQKTSQGPSEIGTFYFILILQIIVRLG